MKSDGQFLVKLCNNNNNKIKVTLFDVSMYVKRV